MARADLACRNLADGIFNGVGFGNAIMSDSDLTGADLSNSSLYNVDLSGANLTDADLTGANWFDATITGVTWCNATRPDGSNSDSYCGTCCSHNVVGWGGPQAGCG
jgi:uncharacterized protein YjbI with pentapeptide repeats